MELEKFADGFGITEIAREAFQYHFTTWLNEDAYLEDAKILQAKQLAAPDMYEVIKDMLPLIKQDLEYRKTNGLFVGIGFLEQCINEGEKAFKKATA